MASSPQHVLVTGGAGYVGSALVPRLLKAGHRVTVLDLYLFGDEIFHDLRGPNLIEVKGDLRNPEVVSRALKDVEAVIHLACISNDPSFELDPQLGKSINFDCFRPLVQASKRAGVKRFVYASSSSVYGVKSTTDVTEDLALQPLTDYSKYKALCEDVLLEERAPGFTTLILRPATVCGYAQRLRLDLTVNILTNHAINNGKITVFGGTQMRPNIHVGDMVELYLKTLEYPADAIDGRIFNAGYENHTVMEIAKMTQAVIGDKTEIVVTPSNDNRSYHVSSDKIRRELGFKATSTIEDAVRDLKTAFDAGQVPNSMTDKRYYNIKTMQTAKLV